MSRLILFFLLCVLSDCSAVPGIVPTVPPTLLPTSPVPTITPLPTPTGLPTSTATPIMLTATPPALPTAALEPTTEPTIEPTTAPLVEPTSEPAPLPTDAPTEPSGDPVLVGAGDIAVCGATGDEATAQLLDNIGGTVFTLGDNVYPNGTLEQFQTCFEESWGRHKARIRPVPGNHDYNTGGATGYYAYFGASAGNPSRGYYSYDLGAWHIVVLNSEIETDLNSAQAQWLRDDLAAHPTQCTVAMMHRPLYSSGPHGSDGSGEKMRPLWQVLYENNVDIALAGHDHNYERFAPQTPQGDLDAARGIREFVVGTGGAVPYPFGEIKPNSERQSAGPYGVLKLTLHATTYDWDFVSITPLLARDRGTGECH